VNEPTYCQQNKILNILLAETKNRLCPMRHSMESIFVIVHLREYESIFERALVCEPGDPCRGTVYRDTVPLTFQDKNILNQS
jgi:hypothetical protein